MLIQMIAFVLYYFLNVRLNYEDVDFQPAYSILAVFFQRVRHITFPFKKYCLNEYIFIYFVHFV